MRRRWMISGVAVVLVALTALGVWFACAPGRKAPSPTAPPEQQPSPSGQPPAWVTGDLAAGTTFLYTGDNPRQKGVQPGAFRPRQVAVIRGRVQNRQGEPLPGVKVTVLEHPEFGWTETDGAGAFDLVVNGGETLHVRYTQTGYLPLCRHLRVPWQDYAWLPDVVLSGVDAQVTTIDLSADRPVQVARGSVQRDGDGSRQGTLLVPRGLQAEMIQPGGQRKPLPKASVRVTEYTVGPGGPRAMPALLPPTSEYTYAFELSADEVLQEGIKVGGKDLVLSKPIPYYVENFLNFPVGTPVPTGYYDNDQAKWVPAPSGRVIKLVEVRDGLAQLAAEESGFISGRETLEKLGVSEEEQRELAKLYKPGQTLWRVPIPHFSTWDCNWARYLPAGASTPDQPPPEGNAPTEDPCSKAGSNIDIHNQTLGEAVEVVGTPFRLHYQSDRAPDFEPARTLDIPLTGKNVPKLLKRVDLEISIAGRLVQQRLESKPNQSHRFVWDGMDAYGRRVQGAVPVTVRLGYVYDASYAPTQEFGQVGAGVAIRGNPARQEATMWLEHRQFLGARDARGPGLAGWTLDVHHAYQATNRTLDLGNGEQRQAQDVKRRVTTEVGALLYDKEPAVQAKLENPAGVAIQPDGSLLIAEEYGHRVYRLTQNHTLSVLAGTGKEGVSGDGGPADKAALWYPCFVAPGSDGSVYIGSAKSGGGVRRVKSDGTISTAVKLPQQLISSAGASITGMAVRADGTVFLCLGYLDAGDSSGITPSSRWFPTIVEVNSSGQVRTLLRGGTPDGETVWPYGLSLDKEGRLVFADRLNHRICRLTPEGKVVTLAGSGSGGFSGDGGPANQAQFNDPTDVLAAADGSLYVVDRGNGRIRRVNPEGFVDTLAGSGRFEGDALGTRDDGRPSPARDALVRVYSAFGYSQFDHFGLALGRDGSIYYADPWQYRIRRVYPPLKGASETDTVIVSRDGEQLYFFDRTGRHLRTIGALTGTLVYRFEYDKEGRLSEIHDRDGNVTRVERNDKGEPVAIVAPYGQRTTLEVNERGYMKRIVNPAEEAVVMEYTAGGLLTSFKDPRGHVSRFQYDGGRLTRHEDATGGFTALSRKALPQGYEVAVSTAGRPPSTYQLTQRRGGNTPWGPVVETTRVNVGCCGSGTNAVITPGGRTVSLPDGRVMTYAEQGDPRWGTQAPVLKEMTQTTPGGLGLTSRLESRVTLQDPGDPLSVKTLTEQLVVNGDEQVTTYDMPARTITSLTPKGRRTVTTVDERGRPVKLEVPGSSPVSLHYDGRGRPSTITQGEGPKARTVTFDYDAEGRLKTVTDPLKRAVGLEYDGAGRLARRLLPGGREIVTKSDPNGNLISLTPPGRPAHTFGYTADNQLEAYHPPAGSSGSGDTSYSYGNDRQLTRIKFPDGTAVEVGYDKGGNVDTITSAPGPVRLTWDAQKEQIRSLASSDGNTLTFTTDGVLPTEFASDGAIKGKVTQGFNSDFRLNSQTINGEHRVSYLYDADGLPSVAGSVEFERDDGNGRITGTRLSGISTEQGYNDFGELNRFVASVKDNEVFAVRYERDPLGRIEKLTETIEGRTTTFGYKYDDADRLTDVSKDGLNTAHYEYDLNGNRLVSQGSKGKKSGRYDDQDRLLEFGETTWTHTARGDWASKAANGKTTRYDYDPMGNLRAVTLPEGTGIEYLIDPADRRIGKKVNGKLVQGFLYMDRLRPVAELDGEGKIVSRFVYATRINIPDYMMRGGETYRIITDHLGSPRLVIDAIRGTIAQRIDYDEFGNVLSDTNPGFQPFGFAGGLYDRDTKLVRFGARDYDAETGRWTAEEPLNFGGGAVNLYAYAYHDPVNWFDASGAKPVGSNIVNYGNGWVGGPAENRTFWRAKASPNLLPEAARVPPSLKGGARASGVITNPTQLRSLTSGGGGLCPSPKGGGGGGGGGFAALAWLAVDELERVANEIAYEHYAPKLLKMYTFEPLKTPIPVVPQLRIYTVPPWFTHFWK